MAVSNEGSPPVIPAPGLLPALDPVLHHAVEGFLEL